MRSQLSPTATQSRALGPLFTPENGRCLVDRLPTELLGLVFLLGAAYDPEIDDDRSSSVSTEESEPAFEVLVSHVCRRWREVAVGMPTLWTFIHFTGPPYARPATYLERSRKTPIDVIIDLAKVPEDVDIRPPGSADTSEYMEGNVENKAYLAQIWALVAPHIPHLRTLECILPKSRLMQSFVHRLAMSPPAPILEELDLTDIQQLESSEDTTFVRPTVHDIMIPFSGDAPNLEYAGFRGVSLHWPHAHFLSGLTELVFQHHVDNRRPTFQDLARILHDCPQLKSLTLWRSGPAGHPEEWPASMPGSLEGGRGAFSPIPSIPHYTMLSSPSLTELVLTFDDAEYAAALLKRLSVPNLTSLNLFIQDADSECVLQALMHSDSPGDKSLLAALESFHIHSLPGGRKETIKKALSTMVNLTTLQYDLEVVSNAWHTSLLNDTSPEAPSRVQLPKLTTLIAGGISGYAMRELVAKRQSQGVPLWYVTIIGDVPLELYDQQWIEYNVHRFTHVEGPPGVDASEGFADEEDAEEPT